MLCVKFYIAVETLRPQFAYSIVVECDQFENVSHISIGYSAVIVGQNAAAIPCEPYLSGVFGWTFYTNMHMDGFAVLT